MATSLGSNSSSQFGIGCCTGGVGLGTKIIQVEYSRETKNNLLLVDGALGILTAAVSDCGGVTLPDFFSSCGFEEVLEEEKRI